MILTLFIHQEQIPNWHKLQSEFVNQTQPRSPKLQRVQSLYGQKLQSSIYKINEFVVRLFCQLLSFFFTLERQHLK